MKPSRSYTRTTLLSIAALVALILAGSLLLPRATAARPLDSPVAQPQTAPARFALNSQVQAMGTLKLLDQPAFSGQPLATLQPGDLALVMGGPFNDGWYWLQYKTLRGYVQDAGLGLPGQWKPTPTPTPVPPTPTPTATPALAAVQQAPAADPPQAAASSLAPAAGTYTGLKLAELTRSTVVRSGPGSNTPARKTWWVGRRVLLYAAAVDSAGNTWYRVSETPEATMYVPASSVRLVAPVRFQSGRFAGRWVDVNLTQQVVTFYQDAVPVKVTLASTGIAKHPTMPGTWHIYYRLTSQEMIGGSKAAGDYYDLPNVPYPQYFYAGDALHGTYWHDDFGRPHSHGCVNLSTPIATWLYGWASIGTTVYVHY